MSAVDVVAVMERFANNWDSSGKSLNLGEHMAADELREASAAVAELVEQQKRDSVLVAVLLSYINDGLSVFDKSRLSTELANRDLLQHAERRSAALARVQGAQA